MTDISTLGIAVDSSQVKRASADLDGLAAAGGRAEKASTSLAGSATILTRVYRDLAGAFAAIGVSRFIAETTALNQRYQELGIVLNVVARNAGLSAQQVNNVAESIRKSGISMTESRAVVTRLVQAQIDLSKATELSRLAQDAAVVGQINSSEALDRMVHGITSAQVEVLRGIGINVNFERSYADLAKQMGVNQSALTEQQKMQARVNVVLAEAPKLMGVYEASMENAGKMFRSTSRLADDLKVKIGALFDQTAMFAVTAYTNALKDTDKAVDQLTEAGQLKVWGDIIARTMAFVADGIRTIGIVADLAGKALGAMAAQFVSLGKFDLKSVMQIQGDFGKDFDASIASMTKMRDLVDAQIIKRDMLKPAIERENAATKSNTETLNTNTAAVNGNLAARNGFMASLIREVETMGMDEIAIKRYEAAKLNVTKQALPFIAALDEENKRLRLQEIRVNEITSDLQKYKQVTESVMTDQEKFNAKTAELNRQRNLTNGAAISEETYSRAMKNARDELEATRKKNQQVTSEMDQLWIQAGRNIQTTLSNSIFDFFTGGLDSMVRNVKNALLRITSEFAALRLSQAIGLGSLFSVSGAASAAGAAGGGLNLMNLAGAGSSVASLFKGGLGSLGLASSLGSGLPGSAGSFFAGLSGVGSAGASSGIFSAAGGAGTAFIGGPGTAIGGAGMGGAATMGASFAAFAGPAIALAAVDAIGRLFGGNKTLGGAEMIPVIGGFLAGLFGHGPMKFRQQSLQGTVSGGGFDGDITNVFRAKGGLLVGNKHDPRQQDIPHQLQDMLDTTIDGFYKSAHGFAENLGLDVNLVDHFTQELQIKSEKGKKLTDEAIQQMLAGIGDSVARNLVPAIDTLQKAGETQFQTLTRLNDQFNALAHGAENLGASVDFARQLVSNLTFEQRDSFIKMSGGIEALNSKTQFFAQNFLTDAERLAPVSERLHSEMSKLGFSADITKDQFKALVQSLSTTDEVRNALLDLAPAFLAVKSATEQVTQAVDNSGLKAALGSAFTDLQKSVDAQRKSATQKYNDAVKESDKRIQDVTTSIGKLKTLSDSLKSSVEKLRPLSREDAKFQLLGAINGAKRGISPEQGSLDRALGVLSDSSSITGARSSFEFAREQAKTANMIADLGDLTDDQLTVEQRSLAQLERQRKALDQGFSDEMTRLDSLVDSAQKQIDSLNGINTAILTLSKAIGEFNRASSQAGGGLIGGGNISGNPNISDQQIRDFVKTPGLSEMDIYNAAKKNGVSFEQYARARGIDVNALYKWADSHGLPRFADGGFHAGGLRIVGERGPELEFTGPSRIASNNDLREALSGNKEVVAELRLLRGAIEKSNKYNQRVSRNIDSVTQGGTSFRTTAA